MALRAALVLTVLVSVSTSFRDRYSFRQQNAELSNLYFDKTQRSYEVHLTDEDFQRASMLREDEEMNADDVPEDPRYFEGDIVGPTLALSDTSNTEDAAKRMRIAIQQSNEKWPTKVVPYTLDSRYSSYSRTRIAAAMQDYASNTCVRFVPRTSETDYLFISPIDGCYSLVGRQRGRQELSLDRGCIQKGVIIHELMHSIGFFHEQSRPDRDNYISVQFGHIQPGLESQFQKQFGTTNQGISYDYSSLMHYGRKAFSRDGQDTIVPLQAGAQIGQRREFSSKDIQRVNRLYQCDTGSCSDVRTDCKFLSGLSYCTSKRAGVASFMTINCQSTCGYCNGGVGRRSQFCTDKQPVQCPQWSAYCNNVNFQKYMHATCRRTCGLC